MQYLVEFDLYDASGDDRSSHKKAGVSHPTGIPTEAFNDFQGWVSYGARTGSRIPNNTTKTVRGIHLKVIHAGDKFIAPPNAGWSVFPRVWLKKDGTEIIFNTDPDGTGLGNADFWSRIYPRSPGYDSGNPDFLGKVSERPFPDPDASQWDLLPLVWPQSILIRPRRIPLDRFPVGLQHIRAYAESSSGVLLLSEDGTLGFLSKGMTSLHRVACRQALPDGINRITVDHVNGRETFTLWLNGEPVAHLEASPQLVKPDLLQP